MRQFVGGIRDDVTTGSGTCCCRWRPPRVREAAARLDAAELAMMERDDEPTQMRYAAALAEWGDAGRLRRRGALGRLLRRGARRRLRAVPLARGAHPVRRRAETAGARGAAARAGRGAAARRAGQLPGRARASSGWSSSSPRPPRPCCWSATTGSCWPNCARADHHRGGRQRLGARRRLRELRAGPPGPQRAARRAAPPLGRGAREAQAAGPDVPAEGLLQRRAWPRGCRRR